MRTSCPICNEPLPPNHWRLDFVVPDGWTLPDKNLVCICSRCGFVYYDNNNTQEDYNLYYRNNYSVIDPKVVEGDKLRLEDLATLISKIVQDPLNKVVDIGGGSGQLEKELRSKGLVNITTVDVEEEIPDKPDIIVLANVIEHIYDLQSFMRYMVSKINSGAYVVLEVPDAYLISKEPKLYPLLDYHQKHVNHFNTFSLDYLFITNGFARTSLDFVKYPYNNIPIIRVVYQYIATELSKEMYNESKKIVEREIKKKVDRLKEIKTPVIVWGCGDLCMHLLTKVDLDVVYFVDNEPQFRGATILGKPVLDEVTSDEPIVVIAQGQKSSLVNKIKSLGLTNELIIP